MSQFEVDLESHEASNVDIDVVWEIIIPKLLPNRNVWDLLIIDHKTYWAFFVMNNGVTMNICNLQMMRYIVYPPIQLEYMMPKEIIRGL